MSIDSGNSCHDFTKMVASFGGGLAGSVYAVCKPGKYFDVMDLVNTILGALVAITAGCGVYHTCEAFLVGIIGGVVVIFFSTWADSLGVDDPVGATSVHGKRAVCHVSCTQAA